MKIESYSFGVIKIDGTEYRNDVIVFPDRVSPNWWRKEGHSLCMEDLKEVLDYSPDMLIIGVGANGVMEVPEAAKNRLQEKGIRTVIEKTTAAVDIFNREIEQGTRAVGAFHLTC